MKKTIEQFGWGTNYKSVRSTEWSSPLQDLWVEGCYLLYILDIDDEDKSSLESDLYDKMWRHVRKNLRKYID